MRRLLFASAFLFALTAHAVIEVHSFDDPRKQQRYEDLIEELRCLVCQNQNLAASNADLAKDLRQQAYEMIESGATKQEVRDYMVQRYGEFVLYRPPMQANTLLLWAGPLVLLVIAVVIVVMIARRRKALTEIDDSDRQKARRLLED